MDSRQENQRLCKTDLLRSRSIGLPLLYAAWMQSKRVNHLRGGRCKFCVWSKQSLEMANLRLTRCQVDITQVWQLACSSPNYGLVSLSGLGTTWVVGTCHIRPPILPKPQSTTLRESPEPLPHTSLSAAVGMSFATY